jgi:diguanylate cyclase (GGDEF)-like protein/PAS domain S-box-containing protein
MERVNRVAIIAETVDEMLDGVLNESLKIFDADRVWFLYPCDPNATSWGVPMERTRPEWPGAHALGQRVPMSSEAKELFERLLATEECVQYGPMAAFPVPAQAGKQFAIKSQLAVALRLKTGGAWIVGLHHCSQSHFYDETDQLIFKGIAHRVSDSLSSFAALKARNEVEERLLGFFQNAPVGLFHSLPVGRLLVANTTLATMLGYASSEQLIAAITHIGDQIYVDPQKRLQLIEAVKNQDDWVNEEADLRRKDGSIITTNIIMRKVLSVEGAIDHLEGFIQDITERKRTEEALKENEGRYRMLWEATTDVVLVLDEHSQIQYANTALTKVFGYDLDTVVGQNIAILQPERMREAHSQGVARYLDTREKKLNWHSNEFIGLHRDGHEFPIEISFTHIEVDGKHLLAGFLRDITERKHYEVALAESELRLRFLNDLNDVTRNLTEPDGILAIITRLLGRHLHTSRCAYAEIEDDGEYLICLQDYTDGCASSVGRYQSSLFGQYATSELHAGRTLVMNDVNTDLPPTDSKDIYDAMEIKAVIGCPLVRQGKLRAIMGVHQATPRTWTPSEISLIEEVAGRCWAIMERARAEKERNRLSDIVELSLNEIFLFDTETLLFTYANEGARRNLGYAMDLLLTMTPLDIKPDLDEASFRATIGSLLRREKELLIFEAIHLRADGSSYPVDVHLQLISLEDRPQVLAIVQDITERKRIEGELLIIQTAIEKSQSAFFRISSTGQVLYVNDFACQSLGYTREELLGMFVWEFDPDFPPEAWGPMWESLRKTKVVHIETRHQHKDGTIFPVEVVGNVISSEEGEYSFTFVQDISERKASEESLRLAASVYETSSEGIMITDADNHIIAVNSAFTEITGYTQEEAIGKSPSILKSGRHDETFYQAMWHELNTSGRWQGEIWDQRKNGEVYPNWLTINTVFNEDGTVQRRVAMFTDISQKRQAEELIWRQANFDALTDLPNRQMFHDRLDQDIKKANRGGRPLALMLLDLDRFKEVNDTLGHDKGDILLKEVALRLGGCVRESDTVARLGGDEFIVLLGELDEPGSIERVAQDILNKLTEPFQLGNELAYISASVGITLYPEDASEIEALLKNADQAMYAAKNLGRNRYSYFTPSMQLAVQTRMQIANDLRGALKGKQFWIAYQPIVELATGNIHKAEALLRWQHPTRGLISPVEFIPIAEDTGLINNIGDWVFREAAQQAKLWRASLHPNFQISVNKSPVQFHSEDQAHLAWYDYLQKLGLPGQSITVEITEGLLLDAGALVTKRLLDFRDAGIQVALDDFGTGYSALSYLKKFDIDYLKIDQSFTRNLALGSEDMALCEAIIVMAHKLDIKVIAEGVETEGQKNLLIAAGCDYGQGYLFSKPIPANEFESCYKESNR